MLFELSHPLLWFLFALAALSQSPSWTFPPPADSYMVAFPGHSSFLPPHVVLGPGKPHLTSHRVFKDKPPQTKGTALHPLPYSLSVTTVNLEADCLHLILSCTTSRWATLGKPLHCPKPQFPYL